jgi:hypothetical protein
VPQVPNGIEIVNLLARASVPCRAFVRNPQKAATFLQLPDVEVVQGHLARPDSLGPALEGVEKALFCSSIGPDLLCWSDSFAGCSGSQVGTQTLLELAFRELPRRSQSCRKVSRYQLSSAL